MSKRIARIIGRKLTRLAAREKPAIRPALPNPEKEKSQVHRREHKSEKQVNPVEADEHANCEKAGVVPEKGPTPDEGKKDFAVTLPVFVEDTSGYGAGGEECFHPGVGSDH